MTFRLVARHPTHGVRRGTLETELRLDSVPARFVVEAGKVAAYEDDGTPIESSGDGFIVDRWVISEGEPEPFLPRDERERELLAAIAKAVDAGSPDAEDLRQVYADWLEENGHPNEASVLALERKLRAPTRNARALAKELRTAAAATPLAWRIAATRPMVHCWNRSLCPGSWDRLTPTEDAYVRRCKECNATVAFARSRDLGKAYRNVERYTALDIAVAESATPATVFDGPILSLPFFAADQPPDTMAAVLESLDLLPPDDLTARHVLGALHYPESQVPNLSVPIASVRCEYHWDPLDGPERGGYATVSRHRYRELRLLLRASRAEIEPWLHARFGEGRATAQGRVYGNWILAEWGTGCELRWVLELPDWALAPTDKGAALDYLRRVRKHVDRWYGCSFEALQEFARDVPAGTGLEVPRELRTSKKFVGWDFRPALEAREVADALGLEKLASETRVRTWIIQLRPRARRAELTDATPLGRIMLWRAK